MWSGCSHTTISVSHSTFLLDEYGKMENLSFVHCILHKIRIRCMVCIVCMRCKLKFSAMAVCIVWSINDVHKLYPCILFSFICNRCMVVGASKNYVYFPFNQTNTLYSENLCVSEWSGFGIMWMLSGNEIERLLVVHVWTNELLLDNKYGSACSSN